jgi:hypothetical protein
MEMKKEWIIVVDTETANTLDQPIPYDIGYAVCDRKGNVVLTRSFVVEEIFYSNLFNTAHYAKKRSTYIDGIADGSRTIAKAEEIRNTVHADMTAYNVTKVFAYNALFDKKSLNNGIRYTTDSAIRWFFPYGTEFHCIWNFACSTIMNTPTYIRYALDNGFVSEKGNVFTNAECAYRFISQDENFVEDHTGLEDVMVEIAILTKCFSKHKKRETEPNPACWQKVQKVRKEYQKKLDDQMEI